MKRYLVNEILVIYLAFKQKLPYDYENKRKIGENPTILNRGLLKYFDTESRKAEVYPDIVEILMDHSLPGVRSHYFKPDIQTLLEGTGELMYCELVFIRIFTVVFFRKHIHRLNCQIT